MILVRHQLKPQKIATKLALGDARSIQNAEKGLNISRLALQRDVSLSKTSKRG